MSIRGPIPEGYIHGDGSAYYFPEGSDASLKARNQADPRADTIPDQAEGQQQVGAHRPTSCDNLTSCSPPPTNSCRQTTTTKPDTYPQNTPRNAGGQIGIGMYTMYGADGTPFYVDDVAYNVNYSSPAFPAKDKVCFLSVVVKYRGLHPHEQLDFSIWHDNDPCGRFVGSAGAVDGKYSHWDAPPFSCFLLWAKEP